MVMYSLYEASGSVGPHGRSTLRVHLWRQPVISFTSVISCTSDGEVRVEHGLQAPNRRRAVILHFYAFQSTSSSYQPSTTDMLAASQSLYFDTTTVSSSYYPFFHLALGSYPTGNSCHVNVETHVLVIDT